MSIPVNYPGTIQATIESLDSREAKIAALCDVSFDFRGVSGPYTDYQSYEKTHPYDPDSDIRIVFVNEGHTEAPRAYLEAADLYIPDLTVEEALRIVGNSLRHPQVLP